MTDSAAVRELLVLFAAGYSAFSDVLDSMAQLSSGFEPPEVPRTGRTTLCVKDDVLIAQSNGKVAMSLGAGELAHSLQGYEIDLFRTAMQNLKNTHGLWRRLYPELTTAADPNVRRKLQVRLDDYSRTMIREWRPIRSFLRSRGLEIDSRPDSHLERLLFGI